jgi:hypothetical protein
MKLVMLRKNGSYVVVSAYLIEEHADVPGEDQVPDGYYLAVRDVVAISDPMTSEQWGTLLALDAESDQKATTKSSILDTNVREAVTN